MSFGGAGTFTIGTANDIGLMLFDGTAGQRASFVFTNSIQTDCITATIIAPGGSQLGTGRACNTPILYLAISSQLSTTGTYTIMLQSSAIGSVTVNSYIVPADVVKSIAIGGAAVNVTTTVPGQNADLTFTGTVGQQITLYLSAITY
jgi:hypothetical protein